MFKFPVVLFLPRSKFKKFTAYPYRGEKKLCEQRDTLITPEWNPERRGLAFRTESARLKQKLKHEASSKIPASKYTIENVIT